MTFFPADFDPRDDVAFALNLVNVNTPDGDFGFLLGVDGKFTDTTGKVWHGSQLLRPGDDEFAIDGIAPSGSLTISFFQDPTAPDVVAQMRALGADYVNGRQITFLIQPLRSQEDFYAPTVAPLQYMARTMRKLSFALNDAQDRSITVTYESAFENRRSARRLVYNTTDHARLTGAANPSLEFIPTHDFQEEKLFG